MRSVCSHLPGKFPFKQQSDTQLFKAQAMASPQAAAGRPAEYHGPVEPIIAVLDQHLVLQGEHDNVIDYATNRRAAADPEHMNDEILAAMQQITKRVIQQDVLTDAFQQWRQRKLNLHRRKNKEWASAQALMFRVMTMHFLRDVKAEKEYTLNMAATRSFHDLSDNSDEDFMPEAITRPCRARLHDLPSFVLHDLDWHDDAAVASQSSTQLEPEEAAPVEDQVATTDQVATAAPLPPSAQPSPLEFKYTYNLLSNVKTVSRVALGFFIRQDQPLFCLGTRPRQLFRFSFASKSSWSVTHTILRRQLLPRSP